MTGGMMFKGTPGPWKYRGHEGEKDIMHKNGYIMSKNYPYSQSIKASEYDWRLIAAAPELLEALIAAEKEMVGLYKGIAPNGEFADRSEAVKAARAAIAKALGEQK